MTSLLSRIDWSKAQPLKLPEGYDKNIKPAERVMA
jgi:hypothetical protein